MRIVVPLLGGGFGAKCDLHFEAQVAALARAAKRPVKLVFSRREEFVAIAQRREGIVMEFETGVMRDGRIVARKAKLVLDKGAYCGEGGFLGQMAAMHACGPYVIDHVFVEAHLNYTNNQPSGSVRAPTAPQVCWGLEQHMDEVARAIEMDPVELRRRTLIEEGAEGPTRQVFDEIGMKQTLERAVEMIGYGARAARRRGDRRRGRLVAVHAGAFRRLRAHQRRRQRHDRDRRAGERQRRRDGDADVRRRGAGHAGRRTSPILVSGHRGGELGHGLVRLADDVQQRPSDPRRPRPTFASSCSTPPPTSSRPTARISSSPTACVRVKGSPDRSVTIADLAGAGTIHGKGSGEVPEAPAGDTGGCVGRLGNETFLAPQLITQAAHVKVDRATGVVRVLKIAAAHDSGRDPEPPGRRRPGHRRRGDGGRARAQRGHACSTTRAASGTPPCSTTSSSRAPTRPRSRWTGSRSPTEGAGPRGSKGVGEPPQVPDRRRDRERRSRRCSGTQVRQMPMTPERVWAAARDGGDR